MQSHDEKKIKIDDGNQNNQSASLFTKLPTEVWFEICKLLPIKDLNTFRLTSKWHKNMIDAIIMSPSMPMKILSNLSISDRERFMDVYNIDKNEFKIAYEEYIQSNKGASPIQIICYALTTDDIKTLDPDILKDAYEKIAHTLPRKVKKEIENICSVLFAVKKNLPQLKNSAIDNFDDLIDKDLSETNLSGANLENYIFKNIKWQGTKLKGANLRDSSFIECELKNINFEGADFENLLMNETNHKNCNFTNVRNKKEESCASYQNDSDNDFDCDEEHGHDAEDVFLDYNSTP